MKVFCALVALSVVAVNATIYTNKNCDRKCPLDNTPVCGTDGETYRNKCTFEKERDCRSDNKKMDIAFNGECRTEDPASPVECKRRCTDVYEPLCGTDGKTYPNKCSFEKTQKCRRDRKQVDVARVGECRRSERTTYKDDMTTSTNAWTPGKVYVYEYTTREVTGIPTLKYQLSGVGLKSKVIVEVKTPSELLVKMDDLKIATVENQIFPKTPENWRKELPLNYSPMETRQGLSTPFKVVLRNGKVEEIEVSKSEPVWVVNMKRGLVSKLSLNLGKIQEQRIDTYENQISGEPKKFVKVEEEPSVTGRCRTYYTIVPLPEYIAKTEETDLTHEVKESTRDRPAFVVTKTKDFTYCTEKPAFIQSSVVDMAEEGSSPSDSQHKRFSSRTSITRYLIRGEPTHKFIVERIWSEGEFLVRPFSTNTETMLINSNQTLVLKKHSSVSSPLPEPTNAVRKSLVFEMVPRKEHDSIRYETEERNYNEEMYNNDESRVERLNPDSENYPQLTKAPKHREFTDEPVPVREIQEQIRNMVEKVERNLENFEELSEKELPHTVLKISEAFIVLDLEHIKQIYRDIVKEEHPKDKSLKSKKQILLDAVSMCGTNPCLVFLKEMILKREVKGEQAAQLLFSLPATIKTPTPEMLKELVHLVKESKKNNEYKQIWMTGLLAVSNIFHKACVDPKARRHNFAVSPYTHRPYCTSKDVDMILPFLEKELHETKKPEHKIVIIHALGNIGHPKVFDILRPVIMGRLTNDKQVRSKAIIVLERMIKIAPKKVKDDVTAVLKPIFSSPVEDNEVRMNAFVVLLFTFPEEAFFTEVATGTWFESSQQVGQFVHSTLSSIANCTYPTIKKMKRMAAMALPLAKPFKLGAQYSQYVQSSHHIPERHMASLFQWAHFGSKHSLIPETAWVSLQNYLGGFDLPIFEASFQSQGLQKLINRFFGPEDRTDLPTDLNIHTRKDYPIQGTLSMKSMGNMERIFTLENLRELAPEGIVEFKNNKEVYINYQKTLPLDDVVVVFPINSGLPIYFTRKTPVFVSIRGTVKFDMDLPKISVRKGLFPKDIKVKVDVKPMLSMTRVIESGVACPVTSKVYKAGHKTNVVATLPGKFEMIYKNKEVEIVAERNSEQPKNVELFSVRAHPYTAHTKFYNFDISKMEKKVIRVQNKPVEMKKIVGRNYLGLAFEMEAKLDQPSFDMSGIYNLIKPHTPLTFTQFVLVPHTLHEVNYKFKLDSTQSSTDRLRTKIVYESKKEKFSLHDMTEEERLMEKYYKNKETKHFRDIRTNTEKYMSDIVDSRYPTKSVESRRSSRVEREDVFPESEDTTSKVRSIHAEIKLEGREPRHYRLSKVWTFSPDMTKAKCTNMFERESAPGLTPYKVIMNGQIKFPKMPFHRAEILEASKTAKGQVVIRYGPTASEHETTLRLALEQTPEWKDAVNSAPETKECEKSEKRGAPYTSVCYDARHRASALNQVVFEIESPSMPRELFNMTLKANQFLKAKFYPYMSNNDLDVQNPEKKIKIVMNTKPMTVSRPWSVMNIFMYKPRENTFFQNIKLSPFFETVLPISVEDRMMTRAFNKIMGEQYTPFCKVQREEITTFDNVTYKYPLGECWHLVTKDCSKKIPVEVFAKETSDSRKVVKINVGKYVIELTPEMDVKINGEKVRIPVDEEKVIKNKENRPVIVLRRPKNEKLVVTCPVHGLKVKYDSKNVKVHMSNMFRGRTCGLCGDFNGEKVAEFKDPQECIRSNWEEFGRSYAEKSCPKKSSRPMEPSVCIRERTVIPSTSFEGHRYPSTSFEGHRSQSGMSYHNKVINRNNNAEVCFSVKPVPECEVGFQPTKHMTKEIGFHCVSRGRTSNEMTARARSGVLEELLNKTVDFKEYVSIPEECKSLKEPTY